MQRTNIDYLTHVWNPIVMRCDRVSDGCRNCWHLRMADRLAKNPKIHELHRQAYATGKPFFLVPKELTAPARLRKPAVIGVQYMGDLFHENIPDWFLGDIFGEVRVCSRHTFIFLTKRVKRMVEVAVNFLPFLPLNLSDKSLWFGVSAENQVALDERLPYLLEIPGKRFLSLEPLLEPINLTRVAWGDHYTKNALREGDLPSVHWVIVGAETGPHKRECKPEWINDIVRQCKEANIPVWVKAAPEGVEIVREKGW